MLVDGTNGTASIPFVARASVMVWEDTAAKKGTTIGLSILCFRYLFTLCGSACIPVCLPADVGPGAKWIPSEHCSRRKYAHPQAAFQQKSISADQEGCLHVATPVSGFQDSLNVASR